MQKITAKLTVCFEHPFWIGIYEQEADGLLKVCKITFGPEPKEYEVYDFLLNNRNQLQLSPPVIADRHREHKINPKRMQRTIKKQLENQGIGTKSQQALSRQHEENKLAKKQKSRSRKEAEKQRKFKLRQQKQKEKHRGK